MQYAKPTYYSIHVLQRTVVRYWKYGSSAYRYPSPAFLKSIVWYVDTYKLADINQMQKGIPQSQRVFQFPFEALNEGAFGF